MADKIKAIRIKQANGTYTSQIPISVIAQNVQWDENNHTLLDVLGSVDISSSGKGNLQYQIDELDERIDNIVAPDGDPSLTEVSDARVSGSTTHNTLKARLDADQAAIGTEITAIKADLDNIDVFLSDTAIQLLETILNAAVYTTDQSANIDALIEELSSDSNVDSITIENGVMAILGLANTPTLSNGILSIT